MPRRAVCSGKYDAPQPGAGLMLSQKRTQRSLAMNFVGGCLFLAASCTTIVNIACMHSL